MDGKEFREQRIRTLLKERDEMLLIVRDPANKLTNAAEVQVRVRRAWTRLAEIKQDLKDMGAWDDAQDAGIDTGRK